MNKVILIGRPVTDPSVTYTQESKAVAKFNIAVDRRIKTDGGQSADFPHCIAFGKTAEFIEKYIKKGTKVALVGRLQTGSYTNKDGAKVYTTDVIIDEIEFTESKNAGAPAAKEEKKADCDEFMTIPDGLDEDGLPF